MKRTIAILLTTGLLGFTAGPAAASSVRGDIYYHDMGGDIYSVHIKATFTADGHSFSKISWDRGWDRWDVIWNWCGWTSSVHNQGSFTLPHGRGKLHWKSWFVRGCFETAVVPVVTMYPDIRLQVYADGTYNCTGHAFGSADTKDCKISGTNHGGWRAWRG